MITPQQIYAATDDGLRIILDLFPQAAPCVNKPNSHFKMRDEATASACLKKFNGVWKVTDFGGDGHAESPIDLFMKVHNIDRFNEAILKIAAKYDVSDSLSRTVNKPRFEERQALTSEKDGTRNLVFNASFSDYELSVLGPNVRQEHCDALHWLSVQSVAYTSQRRTKIKFSTPTYPIFARECLVSPADGDKPQVVFYKIYEPLNPDKAFRFSYTPNGIKPKSFINGLSELKEAYRLFNDKKEKEWYTVHEVDGKPYKPSKLPEAFICSGERDSLCARSLGYHPLWFNSETYRLSEAEYNEITKYVETLYNIPDIDDTGRRKGTELALRFIDIHTVWLPSWLPSYKDNRGKHRKDLRDWMELRNTKRDFRNLLALAMPARFWVSTWNNKQERYDHAIDTACLYNFLALNGFYALHDDTSKEVKYIHLNGNIVNSVTTRDIREFCRQWVCSRYEGRDVLNLILNTPKLSAAALDSLQEIDLDFSTASPTSQLFFFQNATVRVSSQDVQVFKNNEIKLQNYVWDTNVHPHRFSRLAPAFAITQRDGDNGDMLQHVEVKSTQSKFFAYLINSSRLYWRKELEQNLIPGSDAQQDYIASHRFSIDGQGLTPSEIQEQHQCLANKIFTIGFMLHQFKSRFQAWAPLAMDNKIGEDDECNGRSGKSFFFFGLSLFLRTVKLSGRNPKLMDNPHVFDQVTKHTKMLFIDDCGKYLSPSLFYDNISSDMTVNPKNNQSFTIPFEDSPKLAFSTNYVPSDFDPSSEARMIYMVFSDYYHEMTENNDYLQSRSIRDDFDKGLFGRDYTDEEWNADYNFFIDCIHFYLSMPDRQNKIQPPMGNIITRKFKSDMGANFEDWAYTYFAEGSENLDKCIRRSDAFNAYRNATGLNRITPQGFMRKLRAFAALCPYIETLNPEDLLNSGKRIIRRLPDPDSPNTLRTTEMLYLQSIGTELTETNTGLPSAETDQTTQAPF